MERTVAIKKLGAMLGKSFGYRVDPKAPNQEERDVAMAAMPMARELQKSLTDQLAERRNEILKDDAEYQRLKVECEKARSLCNKLLSTVSHYKITVGTSGSLFFTVRAQGDSWEQVIDKIKKDRLAG